MLKKSLEKNCRTFTVRTCTNFQRLSRSQCFLLCTNHCACRLYHHRLSKRQMSSGWLCTVPYCTSASLFLSCPGCFFANIRITSGVLNASLIAACNAYISQNKTSILIKAQFMLKVPMVTKTISYIIAFGERIFKITVP